MARRHRFQLPGKRASTFTLNITSMTDMFTLLLVFLLQSYNTSEVQIDLAEGIRLPSSNTALNPNDGVKVNVTLDAIRIDKKEIGKIVNSQFEGKDLDPQDSSFILPLFSELDKIMKTEKDGKIAKEGRILLQADARLPYSTLKKIMYTASMAGFPQLKMVTTVGN